MLHESRKKIINETSSCVAELSNEVFQRLLERIVEISLIRNRIDANRLVEEISGGVELHQIETTSKAAAWVTAIAPFEEGAPTLDEIGGAIGDSDLFDKLRSRISAAQEKRDEALDAYKRTKARDGAIRGVLPYFEDIAATVELRGVLNNPMVDHIGLSSARYVAMEPIASVSLRPDVGDDFKFQIGKEDLAKLINSLMAIDARMDELVAFARVAENEP